MGIAMAEYIGLLNRGSSLVGGGTDGDPNVSCELESVLSVMCDAEVSYLQIVADFASLIAGWSCVAESACSTSSSNSIWKDNNKTADAIRERLKDNEPDAKFEGVVSRAVRHLESYEALN